MPTPSTQPFCTSSIIGTGSYMPSKVLTNEDLSKIVDTSDEWITSRTGIKERRIAAEKAAESGKPAEIVAKMVEGAVQKYLKEISLVDQVFVKAADGKQTVGAMLKAAKTEVKGFTLYVVGEGIEKKVDDFAAEVAAQVAAAKAAA